VNVQQLASQLQILRDHLGKPVILDSGYRTAAHNVKVGGAKHSQHLLAKAADIRVDGISPRALKAIVENLIKQKKLYFGGIGLYNNFLHVDIRADRARWQDPGLKPVR